MERTYYRRTLIAIAASACVLVAACNSSSDDPAPTPTPTPVTGNAYNGPGSKWDVDLNDDGTFRITRRADVDSAIDLTVDGTFVRNAMDMILSSEFGNTALIARQYPGIPAGSLLAECHFLMDFSDDYRSHNERYFPNASIPVLIDESGQDHAARFEFEAAAGQIQRVDRDTSIKIVKARQRELAQMLEYAELVADTRVPGLIETARASGRELLGHEIERLVALQRINPGVRDEEIEFFREQLAHFEKALEHSRLRLDAVRVVVTQQQPPQPIPQRR